MIPHANKKRRRIWAVENDQIRRKQDLLASEEPLELLLRAGAEQRTVAITMRTPGDDYELAAGFLYNEGVIHSKDELVQMTYCVDGAQQEYNALRVQLLSDTLPTLPQLERHFFTTSACGVCGSMMLDDLAARRLPAIPAGPVVPHTLFAALPDQLRRSQAVFDSTGGLHAAALFDASGRLELLREDVGRHNAVDKLIGAEMMAGRTPLANRLLVVSGRASFELVQKALVAGIPVLAAVGAPSSLAVEVALRYNMTLLGFVRDGRFNVYSGAWRME